MSKRAIFKIKLRDGHEVSHDLEEILEEDKKIKGKGHRTDTTGSTQFAAGMRILFGELGLHGLSAMIETKLAESKARRQREAK
jgi:hypothetical protein